MRFWRSVVRNCLSPLRIIGKASSKCQFKHLFKSGVVHTKALAGCRGHLLLRDPSPIELVAVMYRKLTDEFPLRPAVSFTKRMDSIDLAQVIGSPIGKAL